MCEERRPELGNALQLQAQGHLCPLQAFPTQVHSLAVAPLQVEACRAGAPQGSMGG